MPCLLEVGGKGGRAEVTNEDGVEVKGSGWVGLGQEGKVITGVRRASG